MAVTPSKILSSAVLAVTPSKIFSSAGVAVIATPFTDSVVKLPVDAELAPIVAPSTVPPLISAVVVVNELKVPAPADDPPMVTPSIVPPLMSTVVTVPKLETVAPVRLTVPVAVRFANVAVPVNVGPARSDLVPTAVAIASNSVSNSEPRITLLVSPVGKESLAVKFVDFT